MFQKSVACFLLLVFLTAAASAQTVVKKVLRFDQAMTNLLKTESYRPYEKGFEVRDGVYFCDNGDDAKARRGVAHSVTLNQAVPMPITAEAWSKAENVSGSPDANYSVYVDLVYTDGTPLWGQSASFSTGTHDWQRRRVTIMPEKPVRSLTFYTLFRNKSGKAWFRDFSLSVVDLETGAVMFDGVPIERPKSDETPTLQIRNVAADSDFVALEEKPFGIRYSGKHGDGHNFSSETVHLENETDEDRCLTLIYSRKIEMNDVRFCEMRRNIPLSEHRNREHVGMTAQYSLGNVAGGRLSKWPVAAVVGVSENRPTGFGVAIDLEYPGFFRTGYNEATGELFVAVDFALTKENPKATFRFVSYLFDADHGFRGAWEAYQKLFPDFFRCRTPEQGTWMPFHNISKVEGFEDFGFKFKEGNGEVAWDDAHGITTFRYTEPMTWWMTLPKEMPRTYEAAVEHTKNLAEKDNLWAKAFLVCGMKDADGRYSHRFLDTPWCNGVVWSFCDLPGLDGGGYGLKWSKEIAEKLYGEEAAKKAVLDGEYVDSSEGYVTAVMDFDRNHFAATKTPLVFSRDENKPAVFRGLVAYEYVRSMSEDVHGRGKLMMANSTPHSLCWLAPYLDVMGTETNWNHGGKWGPTGDADMMFRRALCGPKPYCFLMNTDFTKWTYEMSEKFMKRSLAYGMFPGYFSADASTGHYFSQPELYNRDRPLFKKYVPVCKEVAEAGWQPVTKAQASNEKVYVERFGDEPMYISDPADALGITDHSSKRFYFTVFNDTDVEQTVTLRFDAKKNLPSKWFDRLNGNRVLETKDGSLTLTLGPEDVVVLASKDR